MKARGRASGLPFNASLCDVASAAGLTAPVIYGGITGWPRNILYRNNGDGTFTGVTKQAGLLHEGNRWGTGCTFVDFDRDGNLDLFISNYLRFDPKVIPATGKSDICNFKGVPVNCGPCGLHAETSMRYRNNGNGAFTDISVPSGQVLRMPRRV